MTLRLDSMSADADLFRARWRAATLVENWSYPGDWWTPGVDAVAEALLGGTDPAPACDRLGRDRAAAGVGLREAIADLETALDVAAEIAAGQAGSEISRLPADAPLITALAIGWGDFATVAQVAGECVDPLTGLATAGYLRTRLDELYAGAAVDGVDLGTRHALIVVSVDKGVRHELGASVSMIRVNEYLRAVFAGGETIAATAPHVAVVLVARTENLANRHAVLRRLLALDTTLRTRTWIEGLPRTRAGGRQLIADLTRPLL